MTFFVLSIHSLCAVSLCWLVFSVSNPLFTLMKGKQEIAGGRPE